MSVQCPYLTHHNLDVEYQCPDCGRHIPADSPCPSQRQWLDPNAIAPTRPVAPRSEYGSYLALSAGVVGRWRGI